jgi:hypothetical protein
VPALGSFGGVDGTNFSDCNCVSLVPDIPTEKDAGMVPKLEMMEMNSSAGLDWNSKKPESAESPQDCYEDEQKVVLEVVVEAFVFVIYSDDLEWMRQWTRLVADMVNSQPNTALVVFAVVFDRSNSKRLASSEMDPV